MFTQLDLFGELPEPEKPSNQPAKVDKRQGARTNPPPPGSQPIQSQISMELPEDRYPDPGRTSEHGFGYVLTNATTSPESPDNQGDHFPPVQGQTLDEPHTLTSETPDFTSDNLSLPLPDSVPGLTSRLEQGQDHTKAMPQQAGTDVIDGRRYYIQTEIPADPPLQMRPRMPEILDTFPKENVIQEEPRPRYIQTEIPTEPAIETQAPTGSATPQAPAGQEAPPLDDSQRPPDHVQADTLNISTPAPFTPTEAPTDAAEPKFTPPASLRRTRPLMPPKVIMADQTEEIPEAREEEDSTSLPAVAPLPVLDSHTPHSTDTTPEDIPGRMAGTNATEEDSSCVDPPDDTSETMPAAVTQTDGTAASADEEIPAALTISDLQPAPGKSAGRTRKTAGDTTSDAVGIGIPSNDILNTKQYYSIGEVAAMFGVKASLLRYWESEFDVLKLRKNRKGDRFFRPEDIRSLQLIHHLLRERKYTIDGARDHMRNSHKMKEKFETIETLQRIRQFLVEMRNGLQVSPHTDLH